MFPYIANYSCINCDANCTDCFGSSNSECYSCRVGIFYDTLTTSCSSECREGYYGSYTTGQCELCISPCYTCL